MQAAVPALRPYALPVQPIRTTGDRSLTREGVAASTRALIETAVYPLDAALWRAHCNQTDDES